jgi:uncharacterized repeat protein (TIGR01451 family)
MRNPLSLLTAAALAIAALAFASLGSAAQPGSSDLRITKVDSPDPARVGAQLTYTIGVENLGPAPATGVKVTDEIPKQADLLSANGPKGPCAVKKRKVTCEIGDLNPVGPVYNGSPTGVTIVVVPRQVGTLRNTARVDGAQKDPAKRNNRASSSTTVLGPATCRGRAANIVGTAGSDVLVGTTGPDVIAAFGGPDFVLGRSGRDLICAGRGRDRVRAGTAADRVFGAGGGDRLLGQGGPDTLKGARGNDNLKGGRGSDRLRGGRGFDRCRGGGGFDSIRGCER